MVINLECVVLTTKLKVGEIIVLGDYNNRSDQNKPNWLTVSFPPEFPGESVLSPSSWLSSNCSNLLFFRDSRLSRKETEHTPVISVQSSSMSCD